MSEGSLRGANGYLTAIILVVANERERWLLASSVRWLDLCINNLEPCDKVGLRHISEAAITSGQGHVKLGRCHLYAMEPSSLKLGVPAKATLC